jgi:hypothetical protein
LWLHFTARICRIFSNIAIPTLPIKTPKNDGEHSLAGSAHLES